MWWLCIFLTLSFHPPSLQSQTKPQKLPSSFSQKVPWKLLRMTQWLSACVFSGVPWHRGKVTFCLYLQSKSSSRFFFFFNVKPSIWDSLTGYLCLCCVFQLKRYFCFLWVFCSFVLNSLTSQEKILLKQCIKLEIIVNTAKQNREEGCEIFLDE